MVAVDQANAFDLGAFFQHRRRTLDFQVLDQDDRITIGQRIAIGIADHAIPSQAIFFGVHPLGWPLKAAIRTHLVIAIGVSIFLATLRARWEGVGMCHWTGMLTPALAASSLTLRLRP